MARTFAHDDRAPSDLRLFLLIGCVTVAGPATMDIYLPGLPGLARDLGVSPSVAQLTVTTYLVGLATGQFLSGPLSDVYGRRRPLIVGLSAFAVVSLACAFAPDIGSLGALRLLQGVTAAAGMAIGRAIVRDLHSGAAAARYLSRLMLIVGLGPILAPILGGQILRFTSWRGVFVALSVFGVALVVVAARSLPETLPPERRRPAGLKQAVVTFARLATDRSFIGYVLVGGFGAAAMFAYIAGSSFVLQDGYGASPQLFSVIFGINATCLVVGAQVNAHLLGRHSPQALLSLGIGLQVLAGAALLVVTSVESAGLAVVTVPLSLLGFSWGFVNANGTALALTDKPQVAGSAAAVLGVGQYAFGAIAAPLVGIGGRTTGVPMAVVILSCGLAAALALAFLVRPAVRRRATVAASEA
jgi:DHA1 family bicyclomycin/chloramphenicol resistance-like MFS transporter